MCIVHVRSAVVKVQWASCVPDVDSNHLGQAYYLLQVYLFY